MRLLKYLDRSIAAKTTFLVIVIVIVITLVAGVLQVNYVRDIFARETYRQSNRAMESAIKAIDQRIANVETAVKTAASYAEDFATSDVNNIRFMADLIDGNQDISAVTLLYRDNYFPQHGKYYAPTITRHPVTGAYIEEEIGGPENDFCYLETDSNWIYTNKLNRGYWCLPYMDSISTKRAMVTYSVPLHEKDGSIYAVLCADVAVNWVQSIIEEAKPYEYCDIIVMSRDSMYLCHPDQNWILTRNVVHHAEQDGDTAFVRLSNRMLRWQRGTDTLLMDMHFKGEKATADSYVAFYAPVSRVLWSVCFVIPEFKILEEANKLGNYVGMMLVVLVVLISAILYWVIHFQLSPLGKLAEKTREIAQGNFDVKLPTIKSKDEVRHLRDSFDNMQTSLSKYMEELQSTTASKASMESELNIANNIQMSMIPKVFPPYPDRDDIDIYGSLTPAKAVGGDLFDFYIRDEKLFFCIGDVSGKGVPAALVMAVAHSLFRSVSTRESLADRIVTILNDATPNNNDSNMFVTLFVGVLDLPTGRLRYCNAGHNAPLLVGEDSISELPCDPNIPIGIMSGWKFTAQETLISPYTTIFLYTDGLTEAMNINYEQFGDERVLRIAETLKGSGNHQPYDIIAKMSEEVHRFVGEAEQSDDLTMLAIQYTKLQRDVRYECNIVLSNNIEEVSRLNALVDEACEAVGFDMATMMSVKLAVEEAVVNVINYAYPKGTKGEVSIKAESNDVRLKFTIIDSGKPFDPTAQKEVDTSLSVEERGIGGLGIHLFRQIMDSINYERIDGQNILTLRKKI